MVNTNNVTKTPRISLGTRFKRFLKTPKAYVLEALILLTLVGSRFSQGHLGVQHAIAAASTALIFDAVVARVLNRRVVFSVGGLITGLIVADVLSSLAPLIVVIFTTLVALFSKHLLKRGRKPIFNPAAVGLLVAVGAFSAPESWWASMPLVPVWALLLLLAVGIFVAVRVKKYTQVLTFLTTYFVLTTVMAVFHMGLASATPADALRAPFVNSALFLAFFMATDPPTTPATNKGQIPFAILAAAVSVLVYAKFGGLTYLLIGLLTGNLATALLAKSKSRKAKPSSRVIPTVSGGASS